MKQAQDSANPFRKYLLVIYLTIIAMLTLILINVCTLNDALRFRVTYFFLSLNAKPHHTLTPDISDSLSGDLPIGTTLPEKWKSQLSKANKNRGVLLIYVGDCASCIAIDLAQYKRKAEARNLVLYVFGKATQKEASEYTDHLKNSIKTSIPVLADTDESLRRFLNAVWIPRSYVIDNHGGIIWRQRTLYANYSPFDDPTFLK